VGEPLASAAQLRALLELSLRLASIDDIGELIGVLARELSPLIPFDDLTVTLQNLARDGAARYALDTRTGRLALREPEGDGGDALESFVIERQRPVFTARSDADAPDLGKRLARAGMTSLCALPLSLRERRLGALVVASRVPDAYPPEQLDYVSLVAAEVAFALDRAASRGRLAAAIAKLERGRESVELVHAVGRSILSILDLPELLRSISANTRRVLGCDAVGVILMDELGEAHIFAAEFPESRGVVKEGLVLPVAGTPLEEVLRTGRPGSLGIDDPRGFAEAEGIAGSWAHPLVSRGKTLGALAAARRENASFSAEEKELLGQIAGLVAIALDNALAYRKIAELNEALSREKLYLEDEIRIELNFDQIVGRSEALRGVLKQIETVAATDATVLIEGETGSGKELVARAIHDHGARGGKTFVKLNCAAIPTGLLESELFGHKRGAFTGAIADRVGRFELANGGTVFLDEVGEIPLELQPKLLRVLQEREFERIGSSHTLRTDARLIAATNRDLSAMVEEHAFRADLFYRLQVFPIRVPPLRERREDIPLLVRHFVQQLGRRMNRKVESIPSETMEALARYDWPGNIRELQNLIERALILTTGPVLRVPIDQLKKRSAAPGPSPKARTLEAADRAHILEALGESRWVLGGPNGAAARLGLKRSTLQFRMKKLGIAKPALH
jgi:formate hydrogenlyase transcriptional activator